jgi:hypothetical protein
MYANPFSIAQEAAVRFKSRCMLFVSVALSVSILGCATGYNARNDFAPDYRHSVNCYIRGALGRKYYRETYKKVVVTMYSHGPNDRALLEQDLQQQKASGVFVSHSIPGLETKLLLQKEYCIKGSDVWWRAVWDTRDNLSIVFYDYGRGVAVPYSSMKTAPKRFLLTIKYSREPSSGNYTETTTARE